MSFHELLQDQYAAGDAIGLPREASRGIIEAQRTNVIDLGDIVIDTDDGGTRSMHAWRGHSGPEDSMRKGGSRLTVSGAREDAATLPIDMTIKGAIAGLRDAYGRPVSGGKLVIEADPTTLSHYEKIRTFSGAADRMSQAGLLDHRISVPAGDMGSNHPDYMDAYALRGHAIQPEDPYWRAVITGKSVTNGGSPFRPHATGFGVYCATDYGREQIGMESADVTISGAGNVGGWAGYFASRAVESGTKPYRIMGYGDRSSTLSVTNRQAGAPGIEVSKFIASQILDNPNFGYDSRFAGFRGDKMLALATILQVEQPDLEFTVTHEPSDILKVPSDVFIAASVGGLLNEQTIDLVSASLIIEGANGPTTKDGYLRGLEKGKRFMVDTESNAGGVDMSMDETNGNVAAVRDGTPMPDYETSQARAAQRAKERHTRVERMRQELGTSDRRLAANALGMATMAMQAGATIESRFVDIVTMHLAPAV